MSRERFDADGVVRLPAVIAGADVAAMRAEVERMIEGMALVEIAGALRPGPGSNDVLWGVGRGRAFAPLPGAVGAAVDGVFGPGVWEPVAEEHGGLAAPNLPLTGAGAWTVPHAAWHVDEPTSAAYERGWGLLAFVFLGDVEPGGGATVAIAGSQRRLHALAATTATAGLLTTEDAIAALRRDEPWFAELFAPGGDPAARRRRFMEGGCVSGGIPLRVVELTGAAGDVVLMDPRCLHTVSANAGRRARLQMRMTCRRLG
jgi:hypothetical protein